MSDSVTISLLPVSLALVHLPRSRLSGLTQHILRQILRPDPTFLNVTCNEIELSLFVEHHALDDFQKLAKKDARKLRATRVSNRHQQHDLSDLARRRRHPQQWEPVEFSSDRWSVLQIDSHSDQLDKSGARVRELSAPLAAAGISILYQSSYMSDFIFVKSSRLAQVMQLLARAGFDLYSSDPSNFTAQVSTFTSPLLSPADDDGVPVHLLDLGALASPLHQRVDPEGGAVFTRSRSSTTGTSSSSGSRGASIPPLLHMSNPGDFTSPFDPSGDEAEEADDDLRTPAIPPRPAMTRSQSHSPSGCDVSVLAPDLTYVGLRDDSAETWGLKIVKLVAFPELIVGRDGKPIDSAGRSRSNSLAMLSRCSPPPSVLNGVHPPLGSTAVPGLHVVISGSDGEGGNASGSDTTTRVGPDSPKEDPALFAEPESPLYDSSEEQPWEEAEGDTSDDDSDSEPFDDEHGRQRSHSETRPRLTHHDTVDTLQTVDTVLTTDTVRPPAAGPRERSASVSSSASSCASIISPPPVPFFSFTRTAEGSSLTAPVELLAALFPPSERHMVICSDELDVLDSRAVSPTADPGAEEDEEDDDEGAREAQGPMRCLQIDLRKFGLDKHGLVNRFSRTLEENGINHMYNSTYKTANLLVDKAHATRAQALLRSC